MAALSSFRNQSKAKLPQKKGTGKEADRYLGGAAGPFGSGFCVALAFDWFIAWAKTAAPFLP